MTPYKVLVDLGFNNIIMEATAQTQTGAEVINRYQTYLMANAESCGVVNQFIREAAPHVYDNGVSEALTRITEYVQSNKTSWALASACESILANELSRNMLNRNAARQVEKLLEQEEDSVVKYIRSGALKNVMFCESFRSIAKQVFAGEQIVEHKANYKKTTPVSLVESVTDGHCFVVAGKLYKTDDSQNVVEANWNEVSNTFKTVESLLESNICSIDESSIATKFNGAEFIISEAGSVTKKQGAEERAFTTEQFRDHARLMVMACNPRHRNTLAQVLEAIALTAENYDNIASLNHVGIYETANDRFMVIESGSDLFATLLASNRHPVWTINENAIDALGFIKGKTNVELGEEYKSVVEAAMEHASAEQKAEVERQLKENEEKSIKDRIADLTEKFKNDPTKLAVLASLAADYAQLSSATQL